MLKKPTNSLTSFKRFPRYLLPRPNDVSPYKEQDGTLQQPDERYSIFSSSIQWMYSQRIEKHVNNLPQRGSITLAFNKLPYEATDLPHDI